SGPGDVRGVAAGAAEAARAADPGSQAARCQSRGAHRLRGRRTASDLGRTGAFGAGGRGGAGRGEAPIRDRIDLSGLTSAQTPGLLIGGEPDHSLKTQWESGPQATPEMFFQCSQTMIESKTCVGKGGFELPLSDHEQQLLDQLEKQLRSEDPRFARNISETQAAATGPGFSAKRFVLGILIALAGLAATILAISLVSNSA